MKTAVAVVGAGAAGLAAARRLRERGLDFIVVEARDRIGGRAHTVYTHDAAFPIELGAEFIHGAAAPTAALMRECAQSAVDQAWGMFELREGALRESPDLWTVAQRLLDRVDVNAPDQSVESFLQDLPADAATPHEIDAVRALVEGFDAAITPDASVIAIANEWRGGTNDTQSRPGCGYAPIMAHLSRSSGERVLLSTCVERIEWSRGGVRLHTRRYGEPLEIAAEAAIVTLPMGVLRERGVAFSPALPKTTLDAIDAIAMGPVSKVVLHFRSRFWEELDGGRYRDASFFQSPQSQMRTLWTRLPQRMPLLAAWAGGGRAQRLQETCVDPVTAALDAAQALFPAVDVRAELCAAYTHDWQADPFSRGAYSYLRVNGGNAHKALAAPIEQRLFFAGEATCARETGTVAGALESGYRAAQEVFAP